MKAQIHFNRWSLTVFSGLFAQLFIHLTTGPLHAFEVIHPRTEYRLNPLGLDMDRPRLSWQLAGDERGIAQTAYQIQTAYEQSALETGGPYLWDSGKVSSGASNHIEYEGPRLRSGQRVYWRVRVWVGDHSAQSTEAAFWEMGLLSMDDWKASWIVPQSVDSDGQRFCPLLRKEFQVDVPVQEARLFITSLGLYEVEINGEKIGDAVFTPGWTSYRHRLQYQVYDVTDKLQAGENTIGVILGDGWYRGRLGWSGQSNMYGSDLALLAQIWIKDTQGKIHQFVTDETWKSTKSPILMSDIYDGETYDARLEMQGWSSPGFDDSSWKQTKTSNLSMKILVSQIAPFVKKIQEVRPVRKWMDPSGKILFDLGQNIVGRVRFAVHGKRGDRIVLRHAEVLDKHGRLYLDNLRNAKQRVEYILKGGGREVFEPHFTFHGFRFIQVETVPKDVGVDDLTGVVIHSDLVTTGSFSCSDEHINQLQKNILWGQKGNFLDVPTDCPQRDERMGWTGDAQVFSRTACFNMLSAGFYTKWLRDLAMDQFTNGAVPWVIPDVLGQGGSAAWGDACVIVPWTVYLCYGDRRVLEIQYPSMKAWVEYIRGVAGEDCVWDSGFHFGDWLAFATNRSDYPGATTDKDLIATAYFARSTEILGKTACVLGFKEDMIYYQNLLKRIQQAFQDEFVTRNGRLASNTQTAYALALGFDLIPESMRAQVAVRLDEDVKRFGHITTGFIGAPLICHALSQNGYLETAYQLLMRKEYPSWLYPITRGATTIWERWDGIKPDSTFQDPGMNSFNHYAYGAIGDWLYQVVAGIEIDEKEPGYKHILIRPRPGGGLTEARASHESLFGEVMSYWRILENQFHLEVKIPPNSRATITLPGADEETVQESGLLLINAPGIKRVGESNEGVLVEVGSGVYRFAFPVKSGGGS